MVRAWGEEFILNQTYLVTLWGALMDLQEGRGTASPPTPLEEVHREEQLFSLEKQLQGPWHRRAQGNAVVYGKEVLGSPVFFPVVFDNFGKMNLISPDEKGGPWSGLTPPLEWRRLEVTEEALARGYVTMALESFAYSDSRREQVLLEFPESLRHELRTFLERTKEHVLP